ncbi:MAG: histidine phosphatase family protein [Rubrivivax sp.]|nr:histidine phosphatase family protein [Rubrivivax sp.]
MPARRTAMRHNIELHRSFDVPALSSRRHLLATAGAAVAAVGVPLAPGTFDPPGFRLGECSTQRNLDDEGRSQARRIGDWFRRQALVPARVRSSPWCRCLDTAMLAFGRAEHWGALASPRGSDEAGRPGRMADLRRALQEVPPGRFEAWVTHQFVLRDLTGEPTRPGEALVLRAPAGAGAGPAPITVAARAMLF